MAAGIQAGHYAIGIAAGFSERERESVRDAGARLWMPCPLTHSCPKRLEVQAFALALLNMERVVSKNTAACWAALRLFFLPAQLVFGVWVTTGLARGRGLGLGMGSSYLCPLVGRGGEGHQARNDGDALKKTQIAICRRRSFLILIWCVRVHFAELF